MRRLVVILAAAGFAAVALPLHAAAAAPSRLGWHGEGAVRPAQFDAEARQKAYKSQEERRRAVEERYRATAREHRERLERLRRNADIAREARRRAIANEADGRAFTNEADGRAFTNGADGRVIANGADGRAMTGDADGRGGPSAPILGDEGLDIAAPSARWTAEAIMRVDRAASARRSRQAAWEQREREAARRAGPSGQRAPELGALVRANADRLVYMAGDGRSLVVSRKPLRFAWHAETTEVTALDRGWRQEVISRHDGSKLELTIDERDMRVLLERVAPGGARIRLYSNRPRWRTAAQAPSREADQPMASSVFVPDATRNSAGGDAVVAAARSEPVADLSRSYTLHQVLQSRSLRETMPQIELDTISFDFNSATVRAAEARSLDTLARAIRSALATNPGEVFLVEGHTDAVGDAIDNLELSHRRAEAVAALLTAGYGIPPENLVTQGYGEAFLAIPTAAAERANRRIAVRRITPLLTQGEDPIATGA
ncbi:OmpA family protein [Acuticoccus sp. M5D2P5]|uniref:OmpA family protein n=1 Tax=Acuticoccus kalidii TaxID=2910977 RepID=UPI001F2B9B2F|nr:OmpA family protein [Acuticoccus kalidii]MCF3932365.1 OmpA family protein [Acuticoccus kalidii]